MFAQNVHINSPGLLFAELFAKMHCGAPWNVFQFNLEEGKMKSPSPLIGVRIFTKVMYSF
jgi:hypothetical protein